MCHERLKKVNIGGPFGFETCAGYRKLGLPLTLMVYSSPAQTSSQKTHQILSIAMRVLLKPPDQMPAEVPLSTWFNLCLQKKNPSAKLVPRLISRAENALTHKRLENSFPASLKT